MMFVFAPLQAVGIKLFQVLGFASALAVIGGLFLMSGSTTVVIALLVAFIMAGTAAVSRLNSPSIVDVYLLSGAFLIMGTVLISVVARAVFSSGRVTHHRIIGAILVYLSAALTFVALYSIVTWRRQPAPKCRRFSENVGDQVSTRCDDVFLCSIRVEMDQEQAAAPARRCRLRKA